MLPPNLNDLTPEHIQGLIDSEVAEGLTLEFKQQLPTNQSEEKKEFLYDIAAMANSAGGNLIYGMVERRDVDQKATGIAALALRFIKMPFVDGLSNPKILLLQVHILPAEGEQFANSQASRRQQCGNRARRLCGRSA
jgi:hypothetical protein